MAVSRHPLRPATGSLLLAALGGLLSLPAAQATTPAEGSIDRNGTLITATGGPYLVSNPSGTATGEPVCTGDGVSCDEFLLTVDLPADFRAANPNLVLRVDVATESPSGADDLDLYVRNAESGELIGSSASSAANETADIAIANLPAQVRVEIVPFAVAGGSMTLTIGFAQGAGGGGEDPCVASGTANGGSATLDREVGQALASLPASALFGAFVHFNQGTHKQQDAVLQRLGLTRMQDFRRHARSVYAQGPIAAWLQLRREPSVAWIEYNRPLRYLDATGPWATRVRVAQEPVSGGPYFDASGNVLDGRGTTLGVIDSGVFGPHPDFAERLIHNFKLVQFVSTDIPQYIDLGTNADSESQVGGHGTHVTGTVGGSGAASNGGYPVPELAPNIQGTYAGVAPGANLIHYGHGAGLFVLSAVTAYQHIIDNADTFSPPLRAVNNSYGDAAGTPYNPGSTSSCLIKEVVKKNIVMVFAAGNDAGDGSTDQTSSTCKDPTPGVICVASYNDNGTGARDAALSGFSSRSLAGRPADYVDIAAPGDLITSTCLQGQPSQAICTGGDDQAAEIDWQPFYGTISGTSMAAPHVTGVVGLIAQARPELTPGEIEAVIQRNARKVGDGYEPDPQLPGSTIHFAYGAGLLDMKRILDDLGTAHAALPVNGAEWTVFDGDADSLVTDAAADVIGLTLQEATEGGLPGVRYRITLADATGFAAATAVSLKVEQNVAGVPLPTSVVLNPDGSVSIPEAGADNVAVAASAVLAGNVVSFFVPYAAMGFPDLLEPIHNLRVISSTDAGEADYAPSPADLPAALAAVQPMYGRAFTIQLPAGSPPPSNERSCVLPGLTVLTSPVGITGNGLGLPAEDLRQAWVAEPSEMPGKIVFTIKTAGLATVPPGYRWYHYFTVPGDPNEYFVAMDNLGAAPSFIYGTRTGIDTPAGALGSFAVLGDLDPASGFSPDGTITLVLDKATLGIAPGIQLGGLAASIRQTTNPENGVGLTVDSGGAVGGYSVVGNDSCTGSGGGGEPGKEQTEGRFGGSLGWLMLMSGLLAAGLRRRRLGH
ncbi:MAG TPA: S8 family serine peptidase [Nevskiaceae bacterium]|nr:S8 family serine peptidase [Nevskiaceae bacterium]